MSSVKGGLSERVNGRSETARSLKGVLFDKDGTLIDFQQTWGPAIHAVIHALAAGDLEKVRAQAECLHFDVDSRTFGYDKRSRNPYMGVVFGYRGATVETIGAELDRRLRERPDEKMLLPDYVFVADRGYVFLRWNDSGAVPPGGPFSRFAYLEIGQDVPEVFRIGGFAQSVQAAGTPRLRLHLPDSRKVGLAVHARSRPLHVHLAIGRARSPGSRVVQPLGLRARASSDKRHSNPDITTHALH